MLDRIRWTVNSFKSKTKLMNSKMNENLPRKFKRIVAGTWAITLGLAGIVAYQRIWALNAVLFHSFCIFSILSLTGIRFNKVIENKKLAFFSRHSREKWQPTYLWFLYLFTIFCNKCFTTPIYLYNWGKIVKPCLKIYLRLKIETEREYFFTMYFKNKKQHTQRVSSTHPVLGKVRAPWCVLIFFMLAPLAPAVAPVPAP